MTIDFAFDIVPEPGPWLLKSFYAGFCDDVVGRLVVAGRRAGFSSISRGEDLDLHVFCSWTCSILRLAF
jgi:hypothetical protein